MIRFTDWLQQNLESTARTRARMAAFNGTGPKETDVEMSGAHSTFPWFDEYKKKKKPAKKKKTKKKKPASKKKKA